MIINSLLDTDFYKFTMAQCVLHQYPGAYVKYRFKCRNGVLSNIDESFLERLNKEIDHLCSLRLNEGELNYLAGIPFLKSDFINYLELLKLDRRNIKTSIRNGELCIEVEGPWINTIWFEVPILAIVSELYSEGINTNQLEIIRNQIHCKIKMISENPIRFVDFGTRRRASFKVQDFVVGILKDKCEKCFIGTSNVLLAKKYGLTPIGTMAHEFLQAHQQLGVRLRDSQKAALESWVQEYRGALGIALSDVVGMNAFLADFDLYFCKLFDGVRHDSGDPAVWCDKLINHYKSMKIDPKTKGAIFSDGLNFQKAINLQKAFGDKINVSFGIGTNLTNDCGFEPPQIVMKMVECNGQPVAKISDSPGKGMCDDESYSDYVKKVFRINN